MTMRRKTKTMSAEGRTTSARGALIAALLALILLTAPGSSLHRAKARCKRAGKRAPSANCAMRRMPPILVMGMIPATIGTLMPASSQRSRKS